MIVVQNVKFAKMSSFEPLPYLKNLRKSTVLIFYIEGLFKHVGIYEETDEAKIFTNDVMLFWGIITPPPPPLMCLHAMMYFMDNPHPPSPRLLLIVPKAFRDNQFLWQRNSTSSIVVIRVNTFKAEILFEICSDSLVRTRAYPLLSTIRMGVDP